MDGMARTSEANCRFVAEFELVVTPHIEKMILRRLDAGRMVFNALLSEALKRYDLFRQSRLYQKARRIPKNTPEQKQARTAAFRAARDAWKWTEVGLTSYLQAVGQRFTRTWLNQHVDSQIVKQLAKRVALAVLQYSLGRKGRPRFKRKGMLSSLEGVNNRQSIMVKADENHHLYVYWGAGTGSERLRVPLMIRADDLYHRHALTVMQPEKGFPGLKFTRIVQRVIRGRNRFYAQVTLIGLPYQRDTLQAQGVVGIDIGPSTIAVVSNEAVFVEKFCAELGSKEREVRRLQRKIDRQRRANNPDCFTECGEWIKGRRATVVSRTMRSSLRRLRTIRQKQADHRKSLHGNLVRRVLRCGSEFRLETLSYRAFQRSFGRSVLARAPGLFVSHLRRKSSEVGAAFTEFSPYRTKLSQTCHGCRAIRKKPLSVRVHACSCGVTAHRDLYSAFLARFVTNEVLELQRACAEWPLFELLLAA